MFRRRRTRGVAVCAFVCLGGALLGGGCATHVALSPPPEQSAPLAARQHFYQQHTVGKAAREDLVLRTRPFHSAPTVSRRAATLGSGVRITEVADLRPLVLDGSATQLAIDAAVESDSRADLLLGSGIAVGSVGLLAAVTLLVIDLGVTPAVSNTPTIDLSPLFFGAVGSFVVGTAGGGALATLGVLARDEADHERHRAFNSVDADLKRALALE